MSAGGMDDGREGATGGSLPDFGTPATTGAALAPAPGEATRSRSRSFIIAVVGAAVVMLVVIAVILSQTVFRGQFGATGGPDYATPASGSAAGQSEYIPDPNDPNLAPPPPIFTQQPTKACTVLPQQSTSRQSPGKLRGGGLQYTVPESWDNHWGSGDLSYMTDADGYARHVEGSWYSVVNLGRVSWPEREGGYPGDETAAVAIFQCYVTSAGLRSYFGDSPQVTDYRSEPTTVDNTPGWIVQATYHFDAGLATTDRSIVTAIVVDTPGGQSALVSDVAGDHEDHVDDLHAIIDSLEVVS
ncbi:hypothetical protein [Brachybacterium huguangmaarense]